MKKIAIVGAGFSGLSLAHELSKFNYEVHVFDRKSAAGGMVSTQQSGFGIFEMAANGFLNTAEIENFFSETGISYLGSSDSAKKRFIFKNRPRQWPLNFFKTVEFVFCVLRTIFKGKEFRKPKPQETVQAWALRVVGPTAANDLVAPALQGIYAGDIEKMSASLILGPLFNRTKKNKPKSSSSLLSSQNGLGHIMNQLQVSLVSRNVQFHLGEDFNPDSHFDYTVIATSFFDAQKILAHINQKEISAAIRNNINCLAQIESLPLISTTCFLNSPPQKYNGFGVLFPKGENIKALGVLMNTFIFNRSRDLTQNKQSHFYSETWIMGGANQPDIIKLNDNDIKNQIRENRKKVFEDEQNILEFNINRWPQALPHYTVDLESLIQKLQPMPQLALHGNYLGSIGLSRILEKSKSLANNIHLEMQRS